MWLGDLYSHSWFIDPNGSNNSMNWPPTYQFVLSWNYFRSLLIASKKKRWFRLSYYASHKSHIYNFLFVFFFHSNGATVNDYFHIISQCYHHADCTEHKSNTNWTKNCEGKKKKNVNQCGCGCRCRQSEIKNRKMLIVDVCNT